MAEHVAMHLDSGLDLSSDEACNLAAEAIQLEAEAYFVRNQAKGKGHSGFPSKQFEVSGSLSLQEKKARLQQLKSRTECRRCGQRGHWSAMQFVLSQAVARVMASFAEPIQAQANRLRHPQRARKARELRRPDWSTLQCMMMASLPIHRNATWPSMEPHRLLRRHLVPCSPQVLRPFQVCQLCQECPGPLE